MYFTLPNDGVSRETALNVQELILLRQLQELRQQQTQHALATRNAQASAPFDLSTLIPPAGGAAQFHAGGAYPTTGLAPVALPQGWNHGQVAGATGAANSGENAIAHITPAILLTATNEAGDVSHFYATGASQSLFASNMPTAPLQLSSSAVGGGSGYGSSMQSIQQQQAIQYQQQQQLQASNYRPNYAAQAMLNTPATAVPMLSPTTPQTYLTSPAWARGATVPLPVIAPDPLAPFTSALTPSGLTPDTRFEALQPATAPVQDWSTNMAPRRPSHTPQLHHAPPSAPSGPSFGKEPCLATPPAPQGQSNASSFAGESDEWPAPTGLELATGLAAVADLCRERADAAIAAKIANMTVAQINSVRGALEADEKLVLRLCESERGNIVCSVVRRCGVAACSRTIATVVKHFVPLATSQRGCIALPRIMAAMPPQTLDALAEQCIANLSRLVCDRYANYVYKQLANCGRDDIIEQLCTQLSMMPDVVTRVAVDKHGSFVIDEFLKRGSFNAVRHLVDRIIISDAHDLRVLCSDQYGNYIVQSALENVQRSSITDFRPYAGAAAAQMVNSPHFNRLRKVIAKGHGPVAA